MQKALDEKTGWAIWNGKILLAGASKQYNQPVTVNPGDPIPFNETKAFLAEEGGADHWFEVPLNTPEIRNDIGPTQRAARHPKRTANGPPPSPS